MGRYTIRCEGLAYETSRDDLTNFFGGNGIIRMDIPRKSNGDAKGDATVVFDNETDFKEALNKNKQVLGRRYVEVYAEDEPRVRGGGGSGGGGGRPRDAGPRRGGGGGGGADAFRHGEVAVRMTGLPYDANIRDVEHFFHPIPIVKNGVIMPKDLKENRGECFVVFPDREAGYWALKRHKNYIGKRFIDVCSASYTEVNTFCKTNGKRIPYGTNIDRERSQMTPRMMTTPGMPPAPGPLMRPDPFGRDYRPGPDPFEHADPYGMARARPPMGGGSYGREPRPLMDYYNDGHEDPYYHRSGGGAPPMPLFAGAGRGDPRERSPYYGREAVPMSREDSWRDEAKYDMKELGRYGNGGDYGRSPWDNEFDRRMDSYQSNGGGPIRGSSSSGRDGRGGGSRAAAPWERPMLPMGGGGMMVDNAAAGGNFGAIERMAAERRGGTRYRLKMRGVPFRATEDDVYSFFAPIRPERIDIMTESGSGRPSGEVRVEFSSQQDYDEALKKDKQYMGPRYVELFADLR